jgi:PleD family two-component response regulator
MTQTNINKNIKKGFTISAGVIEYDASISLEQNIKLVDSYLYNAKNNGRNQIFSI